ncbi:nuclear transport factor 2 domain-containingprotein [Encephalitozoon cuniculi EcunIII-L]|nr:nuclear transport factor 2 domain-containingprotein [Encephalitozoon cuniculi EcunIII-L]UYI28310.1 scytalone dehydratase [Encephalitozoon cuniculi]
MTSIPKSNELVFVKNYYNMLCNRPSVIHQYYMKDSQLTISKETDKPETCTEDFGKYIKLKITNPVSKVLISHISWQRMDDLKSVINVIGQFVYNDLSQTRIAHQFIVIKVNSVLYIKNEILTFLDEEVVYETNQDAKKAVTIEYGKNSMLQAIGVVSEFGKVESMKTGDEGRIVVTFGTVEDVNNIKKNIAKIISQGYKLEFDGLKI